MKQTFLPKVSEAVRVNIRHRQWQHALLAMAAVVVFITVYMLILPAITMTGPTCGLEEHTHSDSCYELRLVCGLEETPEGDTAHVHGPACYEQQQVLTCGQEEGSGHTHTDACMGCVCGQEEGAGHTHTDACYADVTVEELTCTQEESAGHTHDASCYTVEEELTCGMSEGEGGHEHDDGCCDPETGELTCGMSEGEGGHEHDEGCYTQTETLTCTQEESAGHTHDASCYTQTVERQLVCGQEETEGHVHTDACMGYTCGQEESTGHTHTEACYTTQDVLICGESEGHTHTDACYEQVLVCQIPEHTHTEECCASGEEPPVEEIPEEDVPLGEYACGKEEHAHTQDCYDADGNLICALEEHAHDESCLAEELPEYICGKEEHAHTEDCYDAGGNLICALEEHTHDETCLPVEQEPGAFPEELPEGYGEYEYEDADTGLSVLAYAPENAFGGKNVTLFAQVLAEGSEEYAEAKANLDASDAVGDYDGMVAMDIRFVDADAQDPAQAEEIEPDAEAGPVYVDIRAMALLPEDVDESTLAVQHHTETTDGGLFGTGFLAGTEVKVETVADSSDATGTVIAVPSDLEAQAVPLSAQPETDTAVIGDETAAEEAAAIPMDVTARFTVDSFSMFTVTWSANKNDSKVVRFYNYRWGTNQPLSEQFNVDETNLYLGTGNELIFNAENPVLAIDGYELKQATLYYRYYYNNRYYSQNIYSFKAQTTSWNEFGGSWTYSYKASENGSYQSIDNAGDFYINLYYAEVAPEATGALYITDTIAADGTLTAQFNPEQWTGEGGAPDLSSGDYYYRWYRQDPESSTFELVEGELGASIPVYYDGAQATYRVELWRSGEDQATDVSFNYQVPYYDQLQNGSFEDVKVPSGSNLQFTSGLYPEMVWQTTGLGSLNTNKGTDGQDIEIINADQGESNYGEDQAAAGEQYAELNCEWPGALYQDVLTVPNEELYWWAAHQARGSGGNTYDTMYVVIMDASQAEQHVTSQDDIDIILDAARNRNIDALDEYYAQPTYPDSGTEVTVRLDGVQVTATVWRVRSNAEGWHHYADQYQVPDGQYLTRFFFAAGNEDEVASGDITVGNLIDDVGFNQYGRQPDPEAAALTIQKTVRGLDPGTTVPANSFTFTVTGHDGEEITVSLPETDREVPANGILTVTDTVTGLTADDYVVAETSYADSLSGYQYTGTTVNDEEGEGTSIVLNAGESERVSFVNTYEKNTVDLTIVKNIYGLDDEQVARLLEKGYRPDGGLRFDVDVFKNEQNLIKSEKDEDPSGGYQGDWNEEDWTFNAGDTLGEIASGEADKLITPNEGQESIYGQVNEEAHFTEASLTKITDAGETYYQYKVTISDIDISQYDLFRVWEMHMDVDGYVLDSEVEEYFTGQGHDSLDNLLTTDEYMSQTGDRGDHGGRATAFELTDDTTVEFTNRYSQGQLDLTKNVTVSGQTDNTGDDLFTFTIQIPDEWATGYNSGEYSVTYERDSQLGDRHENGTITFSANDTDPSDGLATATIQLYAGETAHIKLPTGIEVIVTEPNHDGYSVNWEINDQNWVNSTGAENSVEVSIPTADERTVTCTNTTGAVLPSTGGPGVANILTLGTLLTLGAGALLLLQRRRKEGDAC